MDVCMGVYVFRYKDIYMHACIHIYIHICAICVYMYIHIYI